MTADANVNDAVAVSSENRFGNICKNMILGADAPLTRSAFTKSASRSFKNPLRAIRTNRGMDIIDNARIVLLRPRPNIHISINASKIPGNAICASTIFIITSSTYPPKYPEQAPRSVPTSPPATTTTTPMPNDTCIPFIMRLSTSRPN